MATNTPINTHDTSEQSWTARLIIAILAVVALAVALPVILVVLIALINWALLSGLHSEIDDTHALDDPVWPVSESIDENAVIEIHAPLASDLATTNA
jgi:Na+/proline symporter